VHAGEVLGGPLWWIAVAFVVVAWLLAGYVFFDSLRSVRTMRLAELREPGWLYSVLGGLFFFGAIAAQVPALGPVAVVVALSSPLAYVLGFAYLLRVVFPATKEEPAESELGSKPRGE
jgi:hypothetical protein